MKTYESDLLNYPFTIKIQQSHKKGQTDKKRILCEDIFTFDIETTSFFYDIDLKPFLYKPGEDPEYWAGVYAGAVPYIWQFGVNDKYYYGRDIKEFKTLLDDFPSDMKVRIFIHNLSFEWHFLDFLTWDKVFAKTPHKPIKASCSEYPNIEFICTLSLENKSLDSWGKSLGIPKLKGYLDYNQLRTPLTQLNDEELAYCERDLKVMYEGLKNELKIYKSVFNLPLTSTGKIRRVCKDLLMNDNSYINYIHGLVPESVDQYNTSMQVYAGGYTHANRLCVNEIFYNKDGNHGGHYDYTSSYPYEMVSQKFPCTTWRYFGKKIPDISTFGDHAYKMHLEFKNIKCELQNTYIQYSRSDCTNAVVDNGRIIKADSINIWCTEQDYNIIRQVYTWRDIVVYEVWEAEKEYLPKPLIEYVLKLFHDKTALKGVDDEEYKHAKEFLNSLYGMCVTALIQSEIVWDDKISEWRLKHLTSDKIKEHLENLKRFKDKRYFLNYDWGVWISNGARCRLWNDLIIPYDDIVIYADTDSIFTKKAINFTSYNESINKKIENVCNERGLDIELTRPQSSNGKRSYLGNLTTEEEWTEFKTLGAKRYVERRKSDGKLHLTVAGINKEAVSCLNDDINNFKNGILFDKDEKDVNKLLHTYIEHMPDIIFSDGYTSTQRRGVNLRPNGYRLIMDASYADILENFMTIKNENFDNHLRGVWYDDIDDIINEHMKGFLK